MKKKTNDVSFTTAMVWFCVLLVITIVLCIIFWAVVMLIFKLIFIGG